MFDMIKLSFKAFNVWNSFFAYSTAKFIIPIINIIIFYNIGILTNNSPTSFAVRGVLTVLLNTIITDTIIFMQSEKRFHTLTPILIAPINKIKLHFTRVVVNYIHGIVLTSIYFIVLIKVFSIDIPTRNLVLCLTHIAGLSIPILVLAILVGFIAILMEEVSILVMLLYNGLLITSGLFHDINIFFLQWLTPIKLYTESIDILLAGGNCTASSYIVYLLYVVVYLLILMMCVGKIEQTIYIQGAKEE